MEAHTARKLIPFVNDPHFQDSVQIYYECRLAQLHKDLESADLTSVSGIQGQIKEVRRLVQLRDLVLDKAR